ncbi:serine/threonine protein kinase [Cohnella suwonensis]|uniref:non-specific serine/threonine protein kinase n=1 Tax=Cohnella suwonensis TaxID=696072 RepID=A0ABW0LU52_9BACL
MTTSSNERLPLPKGTELIGNWNGRKYRLERLLGLGSNGQVYLASSLPGGRGSCAVKLGLEAAELQGEANILASLDRSDKARPPFLLDVDDAVLEGKTVPFYAMRYVPGIPAAEFLRKNGPQWLGVIGYRLLERLSRLHEAGWAFGDVKSDNVLIGDYGRVELVDYGGASAFGRSVRQFTEIYDRGYWSAGSRTADPAYDLFGVAVLWLHALDGKRLKQLTRTLIPQNRHPRELMKLVRTHAQLKPLEGWMDKAFAGKFESAKDASSYWRESFRSKGGAAKQGDSVPGWMAGLLGGAIVLSLFAAAIWMLQ